MGRRNAVGSRRPRPNAAIVALFACGVFAARPAHADIVLDGAAYVALRRPLKALDGRNVLLDTPHLRQNVVGVALEVAREPPRDTKGFVARLGWALEEHTDCGWSQRCPFTRSSDEPYAREDGTLLAPSRAETGVHARVGHWWKHLQVEGGAIGYSFTSPEREPRAPRGVYATSFTVVPDVLVRVRGWGAHVAIGFGSFAPTTLLGPSYYVQAGYSHADRASGSFTLGYVDIHPLGSYFAYRADLDLTLRITEALSIGHGFGFVWAGKSYNRQVGGDFRLHATWRFH